MRDPTRAFSKLRKYLRPPPVAERCELCGRSIAPEHPHLLNLTTRALACSCDPCALLFSGQDGNRFRPIPRDGRLLLDFRITDQQWDRLQTPINLAFFHYSSAANRAVAYYPSPAGATASDLPAEAWGELCEANPVLNELVPDVEALLVYRVGDARDYLRAPIDTCYQLVGLIRSRWRGITGGTEAWAEINGFFARLKERCYA
jgi:Family of unknown function (DUF5947)